jgi:hypothetical protein
MGHLHARHLSTYRFVVRAFVVFTCGPRLRVFRAA